MNGGELLEIKSNNYDKLLGCASFSDEALGFRLVLSAGTPESSRDPATRGGHEERGQQRNLLRRKLGFIRFAFRVRPNPYSLSVTITPPPNVQMTQELIELPDVYAKENQRETALGYKYK